MTARERRRRHRSAALLALGTTLVVGCGSTIQERAQTATAQQGNGLAPPVVIQSAPPAATTTGVTPSALAPETSGPGTVVSTAPSTKTTSTTTTGTPTATATVGGKTSPGVTAKTITLGIQTFEGFNKAGKSLGISAGLPTDETQANAQLVVNYLNKHGGIAGRKIVPVFHDTNIDSANSFDADAQAACSSFTEDHHVFSVLTPEIFDHDTLMSCLAQHATPLLANSVNIYDQAYANRYPGLFYDVAVVFGDRFAPFINALVAKSYFPKTAKIGLITGTWPEDTAAAQTITNALKAHGLAVKDTVALDDEASTPDVAHVLSTMVSIQLRFHTEGINYVVFEQGPVFPYGFMVAAQSQGYFPHYALTSQANLDFLQANASSEQTRNAAGVTFNGLPSHPMVNAATKVCHSIGPHVESYCGPLMLLAAAAKRAPVLNPAGLAAGMKALGTSFVSPQALRTDFGAHYQDGGAGLRTFGWDGACHCFNYTGGVQRVP
ncbi:MAG TPA: hypothetical protein VHC43_14300 [Mycobacteriales bacterium]|nr:hypothetical protein [Mycobacteriales bacterium]